MPPDRGRDKHFERAAGLIKKLGSTECGELLREFGLVTDMH